MKPKSNKRRKKADPNPLPASTGRLDQAKRFALMNYDHWNEVTGFPTPHTGYYYEIASLIEDAVEFGFGVAHGQSWKTITRRIKRANCLDRKVKI